MTTTEAAKKWGISRKRVIALIASDRVQAEKRGRDWWILQTDKPLDGRTTRHKKRAPG